MIVMKKMLFLLCMMCPLVLFAQSVYTVKGIVVDSITGETEPYATIRVLKKTDLKNPVKMLVTDVNGMFQFELQTPGAYLFTLTYVGRKPLEQEFQIKGDEKIIDLGKLKISNESNELSEAVVKVQKQLVKNDVDKLSYSVADDPDSKTNTALDMLRKVPRVTVDGEDNIRLNGNANYRIFINGKPSNLLTNNPGQILKGMPASSIKNIEVISNPGARYDAEGVGGIINIVMGGSGMEGFMATLNAGVNSFGTNAGAYISAKAGKLSLSANYGYQYYKAPANLATSIREDLTDPARKFLYTRNEMKQRLPLHYGVIEASYEINSLNLLTLSGNLYGGNVKMDMNSRTWMNNNSGDPVYAYRQQGKANTDLGAQTVTLDYQHTARRNKQEFFTLSYRFDRTPKNFGSFYHIYDLEGDDPFLNQLSRYQDRSNEASTREHTVQGDYVNTFAKFHTIEAGVKYIFRNNDSKGDYRIKETEDGDWQPDPLQSSEDYEHLQRIIAAYTSYGLKYRKIGMKAGIRMEHTAQKVRFNTDKDENFDVNFTDVVPSVVLSWQPGMFRTVQLTYNMRISRPGISYLNPFRQVITPLDVRYGNSDLESEKNHNVTLNFSSFSQKFNINLAALYSFTNNSINQYQFIDADGVLNTTYGNIGNNQSVGMTAFVNWNASPRARIYLNGNLNYVKYSSGNHGNPYTKGMSNEGMTGSIYLGAQQGFNHGFRLSLNGGYFLPAISLQGEGMSAYYYSVSLNKAFLKDRLNLTLSAANFLEKDRTYTNKTQTPYLRTKDDYRMTVRSFAVNVSWRIGSLSERVKKVSRTITNDDVKNIQESGAMGGTGNMGGKK